MAPKPKDVRPLPADGAVDVARQTLRVRPRHAGQPEVLALLAGGPPTGVQVEVVENRPAQVRRAVRAQRVAALQKRGLLEHLQNTRHFQQEVDFLSEHDRSSAAQQRSQYSSKKRLAE